jgi:hypothetical protein
VCFPFILMLSSSSINVVVAVYCGTKHESSVCGKYIRNFGFSIKGEFECWGIEGIYIKWWELEVVCSRSVVVNRDLEFTR